MTAETIQNGTYATVRRIAMIDGEDVPLTECDWLHIAPCGCACGIAMAEMKNSDHVIADEDAAHLEFTATQTQREVKRDKAAGFTVRLIKHATFQADRGILTLECPHEPKWGIEPIPTPDGYGWGREWRKKTKHLVKSEAIYRDDWRAYATVPDEDRQPLCGQKVRLPSWSEDKWDETLECSRCVKRARELPPRQNSTMSADAH